MCCLNNEKETYEKLNESMPQIQDWVTTKDGLKGTVQSINTLRQKVKVLVTLKNDEKVMKNGPIGTSFDKRSAKKTSDGLPRNDTSSVYKEDQQSRVDVALRSKQEHTYSVTSE